jgi:AcrR family transcriptional regulator
MALQIPVALRQPAADGRRRRSQDNRARIVVAMLELVQEGDVAPSAEAVAARADVGLRTVFRHFNDMDSLYREMSAAIYGELAAIIERPFESTDWRGRLGEIVRRRAAVYDRAAPFRRAGDVHRHTSALLQAEHAAFLAAGRDVLRRALPPDVARDAVRFEAIDLLLSFDVWNRLRRDQQMSQRRAIGVVERLLEGLLRDPSGT